MFRKVFVWCHYCSCLLIARLRNVWSIWKTISFYKRMLILWCEATKLHSYKSSRLSQYYKKIKIKNNIKWPHRQFSNLLVIYDCTYYIRHQKNRPDYFILFMYIFHIIHYILVIHKLIFFLNKIISRVHYHNIFL